jgi:ferredoxin
VSGATRHLRVEIDVTTCMGSGNCTYWADGVFDLGEDGIAILVADPDANAEQVRLAAQHCPTASIHVAED